MNEPAFGLPTNPEDAIAAALGRVDRDDPPSSQPPHCRLTRLVRRAIPLLYIVAAIAAIHYYRYQISADGLSYLDLAQKYRVGNFSGAVNGYWSPLYSMLLGLLLKTGMPELAAGAVLEAILGLLALGAVSLLARNLGLAELFRGIIGLALIPILLCFGMTETTPDFLACTILLFYAAVLTRRDFFNRPHLWIFLGALGGLGYLAKAYILYFFLVHLVVLCGYWFITRHLQRGRVLAIFATALIGCAIFAGLWVAALTRHYHTFTISRAADYNYRLIARDNWGAFAMDTQGFLRPSDEHASSDPTTLQDTSQRWSAFQSSQDRLYYLKVVLHNVRETVYALQTFSPLWLASLIAGMVIAGSLVDPSPHRPVLLIVMMALLYPLGYLLLVIEPRYFMVMPLLLLLVGVFAVQTGATATGATRLQTSLVLLMVCAGFAIRPALKLIELRHIDQAYSITAGQLTMIPAGSSVASSTEWHGSLYLAHLRGCSYWGTPKPNEPDADTLRELQADKIQYFIVWNTDPNPPAFVNSWEDVTRGAASPVKLYRVPPDAP